MGAAIAPAFGSNRGPIHSRYRLLVEEYEFDDDAPKTAASSSQFRRSQGISGVALYWLLLLAFVGGALILGLLSARGNLGGVGMAVLGLALGLPVLQLLASFIVALVLVAMVRDDKKFQLLQVGKITLGTVAGTGLGILTMVGIAAAFGMFN